MIGIFIIVEAFIDGYRGRFHKKLKSFKFSIFSKCPINHLRVFFPKICHLSPSKIRHKRVGNV